MSIANGYLNNFFGHKNAGKKHTLMGFHWTKAREREKNLMHMSSSRAAVVAEPHSVYLVDNGLIFA